MPPQPTNPGAVRDDYGNIIVNPPKAVQDIFDDLIQWIASLVTAFQNWFAGLAQALAQTITNFIHAVTTWLQQLLQSMAALLLQITQRIEALIGGILSEIKSFFLNLWNEIKAVTIDVINKIAAWVREAIALLAAFVQSIVDTVVEWIAGAADSITALIDAAIEDARLVAEGVIDAVSGWITVITEEATRLVDEVVASVRREYEILLHGAESILSTLQQRLVSLRDAFLEGLEGLSGQLADTSKEVFEPIRDTIGGFVDAFMGTMDAENLNALYRSVKVITSPNTLILNDRADADRFFDEIFPKDTLTKWIWLLGFGLITLLTVYKGIGEANAQRVLQEYGRRAPYQVLAPGDAAALFRRGFMTDGEAIDHITGSGYTRFDADLLLKLSRSVPAVGDLLAMWRRGIIDENELAGALKQHGFEDEWPGAIAEASDVLPPITDIITMAVRDVFTPAAVEQGRLFEGFPEEVAKWSEKQGLSRDWALKYWGAHWTLPSVQMGYEMLHRGVINEEQLKLLMATQDIAPGWRGPLMDISFHPYTRVDIRRMHKLGLLTAAQVKRAYLDIGYDDEKAQNLTDFTIKLNEGGVGDEEGQLGTLTRTNILTFYADGILTRDRAFNLLIQAGVTPDAANIFLDSEDLDRVRKERNTQVALIIEQAEAGTITFEAASDALRKLNLSTLEVERALTQLLRAQQKRVKLPTRSEGEGLYKKGIITQNEYADLLSRLGYPQKWVGAFVSEAQKGK